MEHTQQGWPQRPTIALHFRLPPYLRLIFSLWLGVLVVVSGVTTLARFAHPPSNLFSAYADLLPGQVATDLDLGGFACREWRESGPGPYPPTSSIFCDNRPSAGMFEHIKVILSPDYIVRMVTFTVRQESLRLGDLALLWGRSSIIFSTREWIILTWPGAEWRVRANSKRGRFSFLTPIYKVIFSDSD